jgi:hypothetical protein
LIVTFSQGLCALVESTAKYAASTTDATDRAIELKQSLLADIARLADKLPHNALDELIDELGGTQAVAEVSVTMLGLGFG